MDWLLVSLIAPFLWAIVSIIDNYFVDSVYKDELDGIVLSSIFQVFPWVLVPFGFLHFSPVGGDVFWSVASGFLFLLSLFQYFRSLFRVNDSALMQILWSLSVPLVPFFALFLLAEKLSLNHYIGIGIAFMGVLLFNFDIQKGARKRLALVAFPMTYAVLFMAASMVFSKKAYTVSPDVQTNFLLFCLGGVLVLIFVPLFDTQTVAQRGAQTWKLLRKYILIFVAAEGLSVMATFTSQWAIQLAPAISFVALVESLTPVFVVSISLPIYFLVRFRNNQRLANIYQEQLTHIPVKILATGIISGGIFLISR